MILTPDYDVYEEEMSSICIDLVDFHYCGPQGQIPPRIQPGTVFGFGPMTPAQMRAGHDSKGSRFKHKQDKSLYVVGHDENSFIHGTNHD